VGHDELCAEGRRSLATGRWVDACELLSRARAERESPEVLAGLGTALWWLGDVRGSLRHRERAYALFRAAGSYAEASSVAVDISVCHLTNLDNDAAARGWIARAARAAAASGDDRLLGWTWLVQGYTSPDPQEGMELLARAIELSRRVGDPDLELVALADLGLARVEAGAVDDGLAMLDEALAGTFGGECDRLETVVWTSCSMLAACSAVGDVRRAAQWCGAAETFTRQYGCPFLQARCRSHFGRVLVATGHWDRAEKELLQALSMSLDCGRGPRAEALSGLAELRLRQGRPEEADLLLRDVGDDPGSAVVMAQVHAALGHPSRAVAVLESQLEDVTGAHAAYPSLASALVEAHLAAVDVAAADRVAATLAEAAPGHQHPQATALSARASARVAAARGDLATATREYRAAVRCFEQLDLEYESGRTRLELAEAVAGTDPVRAGVEASRAVGRLRGLGATGEVGRAASLLRSLGIPTPAGTRGSGTLSDREREVLRLVERGMTNPQIAERLFISRKTVAHHVSSILAKLDVGSRVEAAAYAAREGDIGGVAQLKSGPFSRDRFSS
jgi:DNA-binding CsgD family transcriptional regulator/tetratricopeptide (TPR) repeat protein